MKRTLISCVIGTGKKVAAHIYYLLADTLFKCIITLSVGIVRLTIAF